MGITVARDTIVCPGCGAKRVVTHRQRRRHAAHTHGIQCSRCRGVPEHKPFTDNDLRYWLNKFGANCCPPGITARAYIVAGGAPPELVELAKQVYLTP